MEEEKEISLEDLIEELKKPIEIKSKTFGILKLRHIYDDDYLFIEKCLDEDMDSELFSKKFLINQICDPIITLDDFTDVAPDEIYLILKRYVEIEDLGDYFDFDSSNDIFVIFKKSMENYRSYVNSIIIGNQELLLKSANSIINSFNFHESLSSYLNMVNKSSIGAMSQAAKVLTGVNQFAVPNSSTHVSKMIKSSAILSAVNMMEIVNQQTTLWKNLMNVENTFFQITENIAAFWDNFQVSYEIPPLDAQKCLKKYHWFISPNMDAYIAYDIVKVCRSSSRNKLKEINKILIDYFLEDNCEKLDEMLNKWSKNPLFNGRIKIIKDCINLIKNNIVDLNESNLIVPTLIPQIEGIQREFMNFNGLSIDYNRVYDSNGKMLKNDLGEEMKLNTFFRQLTMDNEFYDAMNDVFLDVLFQKTYPGGEYLSIHFSRNKILHGENKKYGMKSYMIRCFMILDFLSELQQVLRQNSKNEI